MRSGTSNPQVKKPKSRKQEKALEILRKVDVIGTKELIEKMTKEKMLMLEILKIVQNALVAELSELKRKSKCFNWEWKSKQFSVSCAVLSVKNFSRNHSP